MAFRQAVKMIASLLGLVVKRAGDVFYVIEVHEQFGGLYYLIAEKKTGKKSWVSAQDFAHYYVTSIKGEL